MGHPITTTRFSYLSINNDNNVDFTARLAQREKVTSVQTVSPDCN